MLPVVIFFASFALAAPPAHAQPSTTHVEIHWDERGGSALRTQVAPGKFAEWCGALKEGESVSWEFESADPLDFNIHWHEHGTIHYPVQKEAVTTWAGRFVASADQSYCWLWNNRGATPVALQARVQKAPRTVGSART